VNAKTLGMLVALFERAVSFYASLVNINAYHQPGVEAGKKAAGTFLALLGKVRAALGSAAQVAARLDADQEAVYHCLVHIASSDSSVKWVQSSCADEDTFCKA
jgi:glucose-6-phosphate isomerase